MFPGTALGVLFGDLVYTWMAFRLARRTRNPTVTAMPLGLDTPSTIGITLAVLGPAFVSLKAKGLSEHEAAIMTWRIGMASMLFMGLVKLVFSFLGRWVQKAVPEAGLLGSLAGVGLVLIGFIPIVEVFGMPLVGMIALGIILYTLVARLRLPGNVPGVFAAVVAEPPSIICSRPTAGSAEPTLPPLPLFISVSPDHPWASFRDSARPLRYLPIAVPFALLTIVGGINVTESARVAGDAFNTRDILLTEAIATLVAGLCGGVAQTTPYIGQPAYKQMGSRAGYTLLTGLFIGLGGIFGYAGFIVELIPRAVIAPILVFVGLDITCQAFLACPAKHAPAVAFSFFPAIARLVQIKLSNTDFVPADRFAAMLAIPGRSLSELLVTVALGNGFILSAMLWGGFVAKLIDRNLKATSLFLLLLSVFSFFGIVHSASPEGEVYLPWTFSSRQANPVSVQRELPHPCAIDARPFLSSRLYPKPIKGLAPHVEQIMKRKELALRYRVGENKSLKLSGLNPADTWKLESKEHAREWLEEGIERMAGLQATLYAQNQWALLLIFQAMDAAGKDGTIKHVMSGLNPQGCQVYSFKAPSNEELDHDFMWRTNKCLPERGRIGIFNRSYYEEVLVARVHPEFLRKENLPPSLAGRNL